MEGQSDVCPTPEKFVPRLLYFLNPYDGRFEDLTALSVVRDFFAGLIVAMVAIPLAMGFAIASSLNPVHGIVGGAVAGAIGALFGGSKYQVYGPTAALIPVIAGIMANYGSTPETYFFGHAVIVTCSVIAGLIMAFMGLFQMGRFVALVPHSIVVGFTIGIGITIGLSEVGEIMGLHVKLSYHFWPKVTTILAHIGEFNIYAFILAAITFVMTKALLKVSVFIPAPLLALGLCTVLSQTIWSDKDLVVVKEKYGPIPRNLLTFTGPELPPLNFGYLFDLLYRIAGIVVVCSIESLLCSRMADRLAENKGTKFNPNKELWGQGMVNIVVPLLNGFPHTGALARTATNIKVGAVTPLAGIFKCILKLLMAKLLASLLEIVPMACVGGILLYVAFNMVNGDEIRKVLLMNNFHVFLMMWTSVVVPITDFLTGVLTALAIYVVFGRWFDTPKSGEDEPLVKRKHGGQV